MNTNKKLLWAALVCVVIAGGIYAYAYWHMKISTPSVLTASSTPALGKVAASSLEDGTYTVRIRSIMTGPEDSAITFSHVTYFEGAEASSSAAHDVPCKTEPFETCVPTLAYGYYVRPSGAPDDTAPVTMQTTIRLQDAPNASMHDLRNIQREYDPVFDVTIRGGNIVSIVERTPLPKTKG